MRSSGWSLWVQCGGNVIMCMPYSFAYTVASSDLWLWWPSSNNTCWLVWMEPLMFTKCWRNLMNAAASSSLGTASETEFSGGWYTKCINLRTSRNLSSLQAKYFCLIRYSVKYEVYSSFRVLKRESDFFSEFQQLSMVFVWIPESVMICMLLLTVLWM